MAKARPNDPCPCGSGAKAKKCCGAARSAGATFTGQDRVNALQKLSAVFEEVTEENDRALLAEAFWDDLDPEEMGAEIADLSRFVFDLWCWLDCNLEDGATIADIAVAEPGLLSPGERSYVQAARAARMRLFEVLGAIPGESITLRDVLDGSVRTVRERTGSRGVAPHMLFASRLLTPGASGQPELEGGMLPIRAERRDQLVDGVRELVAAATDAAALRAVAADLTELLHDAWLRPDELPELIDGDGHQLVATRVELDMRDPARVVEILDRTADLLRDAPGLQRWTWARPVDDGSGITVRGWVVPHGERLVLETFSRERAAEGRALLEAALGDLVEHRLTDATDVRAQVERKSKERAAKR